MKRNTRAALHFLGAFCATLASASANEPKTAWQVIILLACAIGAGCVALNADFSVRPPSPTQKPKNHESPDC